VSLIALVLAAAYAGGIGSAQAPAAPAKVRVAEGVYLYRTAPYSDVGLDGNSVVIVGDDGVLVFDANGTPAAAESVMADIRRMTALPVRFLVLSHWHWDHWYGAEVYRRAFPGLRIVSHAATRRLMSGPAIEFNRPGLAEQLPGHVEAVAQALAQATAADTVPGRRERLERHLAADRFFLEQKRGVTHTVADTVFTDSLVLRLGRREVRVLHTDRAVTPGDAWLWLPAERVAVTGDLVVNPVPFALGCYPDGWIRTLEAIRARAAAVLVPGHGAPLHDQLLLDAQLDLMRDLRRLGADAKAQGLGVEQARAAAMAALRPRMPALTGDDRALEQQFELYFVDWFLHRVYDELDGTLTDDIAPIPRHDR
jgi:glyoxylase-like metal-dependent hydrolase (beta-lactamase superfamily II)